MTRISNTNRAVKDATEVTKKIQRTREERKKTSNFRTNEKNISINKEN